LQDFNGADGVSVIAGNSLFQAFGKLFGLGGIGAGARLRFFFELVP
jgi:hypothetical protein